jgi:hypothetical protein
MLRLECYITFTNKSGTKYLEFFSVNEIQIESTWKKLTDTCKITLPRRLRVLNGDINDIIQRGSKVMVWLGYSGNLNLEFVGYVARLDAKVPFVVECEDEMWQLKQNSNSKTYRSVSLKNLTQDIYPGKNVNVTDFELGAYRIDRASTAVVLDDLQKNYNVYSYFTFTSDGNPTLNVGLGGYDFKQLSNRHIYNMMANVAENSLVFRRADENKMRVVITSTNKGGVVIKTEVGDPEGEEFKLDKRGLNKEALDKLALSELQKRKFDGYKGTLTGFGEPYPKHNDIAVIQDPEYPEREGAYMIDTVKTTFGMSGFRLQLELGIKA